MGQKGKSAQLDMGGIKKNLRGAITIPHSIQNKKKVMPLVVLKATTFKSYLTFFGHPQKTALLKAGGFAVAQQSLVEQLINKSSK